MSLVITSWTHNIWHVEVIVISRWNRREKEETGKIKEQEGSRGNKTKQNRDVAGWHTENNDNKNNKNIGYGIWGMGIDREKQT